MKIVRSLDGIPDPTDEELEEIERMANDGEIRAASTMSDAEKAELRDVIANGTIVIPDAVRAEMEKIGISVDEVLSMLLNDINGKN